MAADACECPSTCDCQNPEPEDGPAGVSMACPVHNWNPVPVDGCQAEVHAGGQAWRYLGPRTPDA